MNKCGIYCYMDLKDNYKVIYVGKDSDIANNVRHNQHLKPSTYYLQKINQVIQNNPKRYQYKVIKQGNFTEYELNILEEHFIERYGTYINRKGFKNDFGYNFTKGGDGVKGHSPTEETREKLSNALKGEKNPNYGITLTDEQKQRISEANSGKKNGMYGKPSPIRRIDLDENIQEIAKEYEDGALIKDLAEKWKTNRKILREKLRTVYTKEEMEKINRKNQKNPEIVRNNNRGFTHGLNSRLNMSKSHNSSGYFRVSFDTHDKRWIYKYYDNDKKRKKITAKTIRQLEKKVKSKNLDWIKLE